MLSEQNIVQLCGEDLSFFERLTLKCRNSDGTCGDGENFILDNDCNITWEDFKTGKVFGYMWMLRFTLILTLILTLKKSRLTPLAVVFLLALLAYNGIFNNNPSLITLPNGNECGMSNLGECFYPKNPIIGWSLVALSAIIIYILFSRKKKH